MLSAARRLAATQPQAVRALANAAVEAKLDFAELSSRVKSDEAKRAVAQLKKLMEDTRETLASQAKAPPPIDFESYRKQLPAHKDLVNVFEKAYRSLKFAPYAGAEKARLAEKMQALSKQAVEMEADAKKQIALLEAQLVALKVEGEKMATLTVDEVLAADPKLKAELDDEIKQDKWY